MFYKVLFYFIFQKIVQENSSFLISNGFLERKVTKINIRKRVNLSINLYGFAVL